MSHLWRRLFAPQRLWLVATLLTLGMVVLATWVTPAAAPPAAVSQPLLFADGAVAPAGHWSVLCLDGVAYLWILTPQGQALVPKYRATGRIARCDPPAGG